MRNKIKELDRNTQIIYIDSKAHSISNSSQLQEEIMNIVRGGVVPFFDKEMVKVDKLRKQTVFQISNKGKKIAIVASHRIL